MVDDSVKANTARLDRQEATIRQNQAGLSEMRDEMKKVKSNTAGGQIPGTSTTRPPDQREELQCSHKETVKGCSLTTVDGQ